MNQIKRDVEDSWKWSSLRKQITLAARAGVREYDTSNVVDAPGIVTNERSDIVRDKEGRLQFFDITPDEEQRMVEVTREWARFIAVTDPDQDNDRPRHVTTFPGTSGINVLFPYAPTANRNYSFTAYVPQDDLAIATDVLELPHWRIVMLGATALALEERGEDFGVRGETYRDMYNQALSQAISQDIQEWETQMVAV